MKIRTIAACAAVAGAVPAPGFAQDMNSAAPPGSVGAWIQSQFRDIATACGARVRPNKFYVPPSVQNWPTVRQLWNTRATTSDLRSLDAEFALVTDNSANRVGTPIGLPWNEPRPPIVYQLQANSILEQNCVTLIAARGQAGFDFGFAVGSLEGNLQTAVSSEDTLASYFYQGHMMSPIAMALGGDLVGMPPDFPRFGVLTSLWSWYRNNPDLVDEGSRGELSVLREMDALAAYRARGMTQRRLLQAQAAANINYLIFNAGAEATYDQRGTFNNQQNVYSITYWNPSRLRLPTPATIAQTVSRALSERIRVATTERGPIDSNQWFDFAWDVQGMHSAICQTDLWTLEAGAQAVVSNLRVSPTDQNACRFMARVTPPATPGSELAFNLAARASLPHVGNAADLVMTTPEVRVPDFRNAVGIGFASGPAEVAAARPGAPNATITVVYTLREEEQSRRVRGATWRTNPALKCGTTTIPLMRPPIGFSRTGDNATLQITYELPAGFASAAAQRLSCEVSGPVRLNVNDTPSQAVNADLPAHPFAVVPPPNNAQAPR